MTTDSIPHAAPAVPAPVAPGIPETVSRLRATFATGRGVAPGWAAILNSTKSLPPGPGGAGSQATSRLAFAMPRRPICSVTPLASFPATVRRAFVKVDA